MYDTKLVSAAQQGDDAAFAALYDRNADGVYDLCWGLSGDAEEASRLVTDVFTLAARHLEQITEASQMGPWLLAIARDRLLGEDDAGTLRVVWGTDRGGGPVPDEPLGGSDLRRWARSAGATLALADQVVAELAVRHDLDDEQLAAAIGVDPGRVQSIVDQVAAEADQVVGALILARQGRRDCPELAALLEGWDGTPAVDVAEAVDRHAQSCRRCGLRRSVESPFELLAAAPAATPPPDLRNRVLEAAVPELPGRVAAPAGGVATGPSGAAASATGTASVSTGGRAGSTPPARPAGGAAAGAGAAGVAGRAPAAAGPASGAAGAVAVADRAASGPGGGGPPGPMDHPAERPPWGMIAAIGAALVVLIVALVLVFQSPGHTNLATNKSTSPSLAPGTSLAPPPTAAGTVVPVDSTTTPSTAPPIGSQLRLNTTSVNLGSQATAAQVVLSNAGTSAASWHAVSGASWLSAAPASGSVSPGGSVYVTFRLDRSSAPSGPFNVRVQFVPSEAGASTVSMSVYGTNAPAETSTTTSTTVSGAGPAVTNVSATPTTISAAPCPNDQTTVTATVTDGNTLTSVVVSYALPDGQRGSTPMTQSGNVWSASIGASTKTGTLTFQVSANDSAGLSATSDTHSVTVQRCPV